MADEKWSVGRSVNAAKGIPGTTTDCSAWESDVPAEKWSVGRSVNAAKGIPGTTTDCSTWDHKPSARIVVRTTYSPDTPKEVVAKHAFVLIEKLKTLAPDLGLEYDDERSVEPPDQRRVTFAISPTRRVPDLRTRLVGLLLKVCDEPNVPISGLMVEWDDEPTRTAA